MRVERGEHLDAIGVLRQPRKLLAQRLAHDVHEVRRLGVERALHDFDGLGRRARGGIGRDELFFRHRAQHDVATLAAPGRRRKRRPVVRRLNDAGDGGRLAEREVGDVLAEEEARGLGDAVHGKRAALAEVDVVEIQLEDLVLRRLALEDDRHVLLGELALERLLGREEEVLHQLLRDGAAAHQVRPIAAQVGDDGADGANDVDAGMVVEAAILDRQHRLHHARRNRRERDAPPLLTARADERRQQRRVQRHPRYRRVVDFEARHAQHRRDGSAGRGRWLGLLEVDAHQPALGGAVPGQQHDGAAADGELAGLLDARALRVAKVVEAVDQLVIAKRLSLVQLERPRVDAGQHAIALAVQARVDLSAEGHPPVAEHADGDHAAEQDHQRQCRSRARAGLRMIRPRSRPAGRRLGRRRKSWGPWVRS